MNEKQILERSIANHQKAIDKAKSELSALDKPKLRHGDYGTTGSGYNFLIADNGKELCWVNDSYVALPIKSLPDETFICLGNIFDDLKAMSEDLTEFVSTVRFGDKIQTFIGSKGIKIHFINKNCKYPENDRELNLEEATEYYRNFGQLLATFKRGKKRY